MPSFVISCLFPYCCRLFWHLFAHTQVCMQCDTIASRFPRDGIVVVVVLGPYRHKNSTFSLRDSVSFYSASCKTDDKPLISSHSSWQWLMLAFRVQSKNAMPLFVLPYYVWYIYTFIHIENDKVEKYPIQFSVTGRLSLHPEFFAPNILLAGVCELVHLCVKHQNWQANKVKQNISSSECDM